MPLPTCSPIRPLPSPGSWNLLPARGRGPCEELLRLLLFPHLSPFSSPEKHTEHWGPLSRGSSWGSGVLLSGKNTSYSFNCCRRCAFPRCRWPSSPGGKCAKWDPLSPQVPGAHGPSFLGLSKAGMLPPCGPYWCCPSVPDAR